MSFPKNKLLPVQSGVCAALRHRTPRPRGSTGLLWRAAASWSAVAERSADTALDSGSLGRVSKTILKLIVLIHTAVVALGANTPAASMPSMGAAMFRMVGSLALVIALFFAAAWVFRNLHRFKPAGVSHRKLQVLEGKSLGPRQAVYVVAYEQQRLLIGASAQGLTLLTHLPEGEAQTDSPSSERILPVSFGEALLQALGRK